MIHEILLLVGEGGGSEHCDGRPLWHDDQLHLAEWQALQQIEYLFNLTLTIDAKNIALEKLKAHKKGTSAHAEATDLSEPMNKLRSADDDELHAIANPDPVLDEIPQADKRRGVVLPITDKAVLIRLLTREEEVAQARQLGQGRREALQCMREAADAYGTPEHSQTKASDPSEFGASEHKKVNRLRTIETFSRNSARPMRKHPRAKLSPETRSSRHRMRSELNSSRSKTPTGHRWDQLTLQSICALREGSRPNKEGLWHWWPEICR